MKKGDLKFLSLAELKPNEEFIVVKIRTEKETAKKLVDMGFTQNSKGRVVRRGMFRGTVQVMIQGYNIMMRYHEALKIEVEKFIQVPFSNS